MPAIMSPKRTDPPSWNDHYDELVEGNTRDWPLSFCWYYLDRQRPHFGCSTLSWRKAEAKTCILLEAALAALTERRVSFSCREAFYVGRERYGGPAFSYTCVVPQVKRLGTEGLLDVVIVPGRGPSGRQSTFGATEKLMEQMGPNFPALVAHDPRELVRLRDPGRRLIDYQETDRTFAMRKKLVELNEAIASIRIDRPFHTVVPAQHQSVDSRRIALYRVFNGDFSNGGRMYGPWWQSIPKRDRARIKIAGQSVVEVDHAQLHPRLLYKLYGLQPDGDAYTIEGYCRSQVKPAFNILLNAPTYASALGAISKELNGDRALAALLIEDLKRKHVSIKDAFHTGVGLRLQAIDANMAEGVLCGLLRRGVVALPVHDSFIVPAQHEQVLEEAMAKSFREVPRF